MICYCLSIILSTLLWFSDVATDSSSILFFFLLFQPWSFQTHPTYPWLPYFNIFASTQEITVFCSTWVLTTFLKTFHHHFSSTMKTDHGNGEMCRRKVFIKCPMRSGRINELKHKRHCGEFSVRRTECSDSLYLGSPGFPYSLVEHIKMKWSMSWDIESQSTMAELCLLKTWKILK